MSATSLPAKTRAGTPLTSKHEMRVDISFNDAVKGLTRHGTVDLENRMYQIGGQYSDFHFRIRDLVTMPLAVWTQVKEYGDRLNYIEWYDREEDAAYLVSFVDAVEHGTVYQAGIGPRYGVPRKDCLKVTERLS